MENPMFRSIDLDDTIFLPLCICISEQAQTNIARFVIPEQ